MKEINYKVFKFLSREQEKNNNLYFTVRRNNNQNRLSDGYCFVGDTIKYMNVSFWKGSDTVNKSYRIGFVVCQNGDCKLELVARDEQSAVLRELFKNLATKLGGFELKTYKKNNGEKWNKFYEGPNYIQTLETFINNEKRIIDQMILDEDPEGIGFISPDEFSESINRIKDIMNRLDVIE